MANTDSRPPGFDEALAILALYMERRSRLSAEVQARSRLLELVHMNQSATAGALSASIAHELNQPLGAIRSNAEAAEAILKGKAPDLNLVQQILADIRDDDQRAGEIIIRLRGMLKKRSEIDWQEFDLNEVVDSAINILHAEAAKKQVAVSAEQSKIKLPVRADKVHLQQVILNLATNAMDAMAEAATVDRKLVLQTTLHGDTKVEMSISDTGQGHSERTSRQHFRQHSTRPSRTEPGWDFPSLARSWKLTAERSGRTIVPAAAPCSVSSCRSPRLRERHGTDHPHRRRRSIVSNGARTSCRNLWLSLPVATSSGEDFLARLPKSEAGCILLDLRMPGLSGTELQDRLAQAVPLLPIVFLTGQGTIAASVQAMKAGADDFLEKPVSSKILREVIERALAQNEKRRDGRSQMQTLQAKVSNLTPRETQVFDLVVRGKRNKQVAYDLNTSERTIKAHRHSIMEKLNVTSLAEMVSIAERLGRIEVDTVHKSTAGFFPKGQYPTSLIRLTIRGWVRMLQP